MQRQGYGMRRQPPRPVGNALPHCAVVTEGPAGGGLFTCQHACMLRPGLLQMPRGVHSSMQDADNLDPVASISKIDDVRSGRVFEIAGPHINIATFLRSCGQAPERVIKLVLISLGLLQRPTANRVAPYLAKVGLGGRREPERPFSGHIRRAFRL